MRAVGFLTLVFSAGVLFYAAGGLPPVGDGDSAPNTHVSPRYIEKSMEEIATPNMVTTIIADYRGYDTLGETTVIFTAGLACLFILGARRRKEDDEE